MYHAFDPQDSMFRHNILISRGKVTSAAFIRSHDPSHAWMQSPYEMFTVEREKEMAFEAVRASLYPNNPSRLGSLYLFESEADAEAANERWWGKGRIILPAKILAANREGSFDSALLAAAKPYWGTAAERYWSGERTASPLVEVLLEGAIQLQGWEPYGKFIGLPVGSAGPTS